MDIPGEFILLEFQMVVGECDIYNGLHPSQLPQWLAPQASASVVAEGTYGRRGQSHQPRVWR